MRKTVLLLLISILCACSSPHSKNDTIKKTKRDTIAINRGIPFRCEDLEKYDVQNFSDTVLSEKEFKGLSRCAGNIDKNFETGYLGFKGVDYIKLKSEVSFNDSLSHFNGKVVCRLPNIGFLECYYNIKKINKYPQDQTFEQEGIYCTEAGNLILYNPIKKSIKSINVFYTVSAAFTSYERRFILNKDGEIKIFDIKSDEEKTVLRKSFEINVLNSGEIKIKSY